MSHDSKRASTKVFMHPIKSDLGRRICQAWEPLVYLLGGFCHSNQYFDIFRRQS